MINEQFTVSNEAYTITLAVTLRYIHELKQNHFLDF